MKGLFGKCGVDCGRCPRYRANARADEDRQLTSDGPAGYLGARLRPDGISCDGCQTPDPWASGNILPDKSCMIRPCAVETGVETCAYCSAYPCRAHGPDIDWDKIASRLATPTPEEDNLTFIKPYERFKNLDQIRASLSPRDIVDAPEPKPVNARIVPFPRDLPLSQDETAALKAVHGLLANVMSARAETYAWQLLCRRCRPHALRLLWVVGLHGELMDEHGSQIVLDGATSGSRKECGWMVRKRDNSFDGPTLEAAGFLKDLGVRVEFAPLKKDWLLKLSFEEAAGGDAALKALMRYITTLVEKHGEPIYAGRTRLKGQAFALFSKANMWSLSG